mmetsp:Transcript_3545/g.8846  ORF Transcript_3545/g.8846 Transcript_3545/m.8846 type:complete len:784 (+) Transcript_3545:120-2471(+)
MGATAGKQEESLIQPALPSEKSESSVSRTHHGGLKSLRTASYKAGKKLALRRWRNRKQQAQLFGVVRHAERADVLSAVWCGMPWLQSEDFRRYPLDPPLSDAGVEVAKGVAKRLRSAFQKAEGSMTIVVSSPYYRCVQTATHIAKELKTGILIDRSLGEIYGPTVMGDFQPPDDHIRPPEDTWAYCHQHNVPCQRRCLGQWPVWPEQLRNSQRRYADRFVKYLHRSIIARRNFLIVTHADCVATALSMMPSQVDRSVQHVDYCGYFLAERYVASPRTSIRKLATGSEAEELEATVKGTGHSSRSVTNTTTSGSRSRSSRSFPAEAAAISLQLETTVVQQQSGPSTGGSSSPPLSQQGSRVFSGNEGVEAIGTAVSHCVSGHTPSGGNRKGLMKFELFGSATAGSSPRHATSGSRRNSGESSGVPIAEVSRGWSVSKSGITAPLRNSGWSGSFQKRLQPLIRHSKYEFNYIEELLGALNTTAIGKEQVDPQSMNRRNFHELPGRIESGRTPRTTDHRVNWASNYASDTLTESSSQSTLLFGASEISELDSEGVVNTQAGDRFFRTNSMKSVPESPTVELRRSHLSHASRSWSSTSSPNTPCTELSPGAASSSPRRSWRENSTKKVQKGNAALSQKGAAGELLRRSASMRSASQGAGDSDIAWELDADVLQEEQGSMHVLNSNFKAGDQRSHHDPRSLGKPDVPRAKVWATAGQGEQRRHSAQVAQPAKPLQSLCSVESSQLLQRRRPGINAKIAEESFKAPSLAGHESASPQSGEKKILHKVSL